MSGSTRSPSGAAHGARLLRRDVRRLLRPPHGPARGDPGRIELLALSVRISVDLLLDDAPLDDTWTPAALDADAWWRADLGHALVDSDPVPGTDGWKNDSGVPAEGLRLLERLDRNRDHRGRRADRRLAIRYDRRHRARAHGDDHSTNGAIAVQVVSDGYTADDPSQDFFGSTIGNGTTLSGTLLAGGMTVESLSASIGSMVAVRVVGTAGSGAVTARLSIDLAMKTC